MTCQICKGEGILPPCCPIGSERADNCGCHGLEYTCDACYEEDTSICDLCELEFLTEDLNELQGEDKYCNECFQRMLKQSK